MCARGLKQTAVTAGTLFDRRRVLTVCFTACRTFASQKDGISALSLQRTLEISSYPAAWAMLHPLRQVLVRPGRDWLTGTVEADETYFGGEESELRSGRQKRKSLVVVAALRKESHGFGRCRMAMVRWAPNTRRPSRSCRTGLPHPTTAPAWTTARVGACGQFAALGPRIASVGCQW
jgi:hypothetical protein